MQYPRHFSPGFCGAFKASIDFEKEKKNVQLNT